MFDSICVNCVNGLLGSDSRVDSPECPSGQEMYCDK